MRGRSDVYNIDVGLRQQIPKISVTPGLSARLVDGFFEVFFVDITNGHEFGAFIAKMSAAHAAYPDDALGQGIAGG